MGMAPQLMATKGRLRRSPPLWMAWAKSSLPVPVSPQSSTGAVLAAAMRAWRRACPRQALDPRMESKVK